MSVRWFLVGSVDVRHRRRPYEEQKGAEFVADVARAGLEHVRTGQLGAEADSVSTAKAVEHQGSATSSEAEGSYDAPGARAARTAALVDAGTPASTVKARTAADKLNAHDPRGTAAAGGHRSPTRKAAVTRAPHKAPELGR